MHIYAYVCIYLYVCVYNERERLRLIEFKELARAIMELWRPGKIQYMQGRLAGSILKTELQFKSKGILLSTVHGLVHNHMYSHFSPK